LLLTEKYIKEATKTNSEDLSVISTRRPYLIPVLNRGEKVSVSCLVKNDKGEMPYLYINGEHSGLKFIGISKVKNVIWGVDQTNSTLLGLIVSIFFLIPIFYFGQSKIFIILLTFISGVFCIVPGILILKFYKIVLKNIRN
jgi:hypothetical protein